MKLEAEKRKVKSEKRKPQLPFLMDFKRYKSIAYALSAGLLLALSWPARGFPLLVFLAFIPLFFLEEDFYRNRNERGSVQFFLHTWVAFFVFNLLTTWWIMFATFPGMVVAVILNSVFMTVPWWLMHLSRRILPGNQGPFSIIFLWLSYEFLHARWELSWSWLDLGNVFATWPAWVQWYEITGTTGGSFWVLLINLLLFPPIFKYFSLGYIDKKARASALLAVVFFILPVLFSFKIWIDYDEDVNPVHLVVIQPSEDPYDQPYTQSEISKRVDRMIALADQKIISETRFVIAPEVANPIGIWKHEEVYNYTVRRLRQHVSENPGVAWVMGTFSYELFDPSEEKPMEARPLDHTGKYYVSYNSIVLIEEGQPLQYYHKSKLVPGIERMPYFSYLRPIGKLVDRFGGISGSLGRQEDRTLFKTVSDVTLAPVVCYESIYGEYLTDFYKKGAGLLVIVTNDGWWRNTPGYRQHQQYARLRAIESRRSIARSASTGISSFINQRGEEIKATNWWQPEAISANLNINHRITFFTATGNFLGKLSLFLVVLLIFYMISQKLIRR